MEDALEELRENIDKLDEELLSILSKRLNIVRKIGILKRDNNIDLHDEQRRLKVLESQLSRANSLNLPQDLVKKLYDLIHEYSLEIEKNSK